MKTKCKIVAVSSGQVSRGPGSYFYDGCSRGISGLDAWLKRGWKNMCKYYRLHDKEESDLCFEDEDILLDLSSNSEFGSREYYVEEYTDDDVNSIQGN